MNRIPNELSKQFVTCDGRKKLIGLYGNSDSMFFGNNEDGEAVYVSISSTGIVLKTQQENGWVRVNYYDETGAATGETFEGRWK